MNTPDNRPDLPLEQRARQLYHAAARHIDPATAGGLRAVRRQALESAHTPARQPARWLIPAGACAAIALAVMMVWQPLPRHQMNTGVQTTQTFEGSNGQDNDLPPDADQVDPLLYQNLDFYGWLAANDSKPATR